MVVDHHDRGRAAAKFWGSILASITQPGLERELMSEGAGILFL